MVEWVDSVIKSVGPLGYLLLCLAALLEYLVPPMPGDTIVLLGGVYAVRGQQPWWLVFVAVVLGSVGGAAVTYLFGRFLGRRMRARPTERPLLGITAERLQAVHVKMHTWGAWLLLFNRFLPGVRGLIFIAAGASSVPLPRTLVLGGLSAVMHTGVILGLGAALGGNLERLEFYMQRYQWAALGLLGVAAVAVVVRLLVRRRQPEAS